MAILDNVKTLKYNYKQEFKIYGVTGNKTCVVFRTYPTKEEYKYTDKEILKIVYWARKKKYSKIIILYLFALVTARGENLFRYGFSVAEGRESDKIFRNTFRNKLITDWKYFNEKKSTGSSFQMKKKLFEIKKILDDNNIKLTSV